MRRIVIILASCLAFLILLAGYWQLRRAFNRSIDIQGTVVREDTGEPASKAKVLLTVYENRFMQMPKIRYYWCYADDNGKLRVQVECPIKIDGLRLEAITRDSWYAEDEHPGRRVELRVRLLGYGKGLAGKYGYNSFRGTLGDFDSPIIQVKNTAVP